MVITFLQEIIFDSGKAEVKPEGLSVLSKVAKVVQEQAKDYPVVVEGHTDNVPIRVSGWKSNWELSAARALSVLHHFVDNEGIDPTRLAVMGYGEFKPVSDNSSAEGRRQNRRVEIVIFPEKISKVKPA
ncbi:MAG: OmpA family protein [Candidatus Omnitrophica bacterium]|nr:OmpA family protein [Candidatus Omnitrophota bacterium]